MAEGIQIKNLPSTTAIKQGDTMTIVRDKQNKQLALDVFANESDLATLSPLENRCDEVKAKIEVDEYSAEITTSQSMSKIGTDDSGANLHENVLDGAFELCVLKGHTKYRDIDTGEILENFEESRNLELITVRMPILSTVGKNLFDVNAFAKKCGGTVSDNEYDSTGNVTDSIYDIFIPKGSTIRYTVTQIPTSGVPSSSAFAFIKEDGSLFHRALNNLSTYTITAEENFIGIKIVNYSNGWKFKDLQIEEGSVATSYEPYKSSILSCNEEVELRGIGDVRDTLNLLTGELTQRIGEVVLDGSENWIYEPTYTNENVYGCYILLHQLSQPPKPYNFSFANNVFPNITNSSYRSEGFATNPGTLSLRIAKDKLESADLSGFKKYLQNHPVTLQYPLATESIKTVGLSGYPFSYENGHVILSSGSTEPSLTPTVTYKVPVSRVGQIASNTKSNLRQTIKLDQLEVLVYQSLINTEYENLLVQNSAESATSFTNLSTNDPKDELYYMLKHLIEEDQPVQNILDKINLFYLYGLLSDEHYFDLLLGGEEDVY